MPSSTRDGAWAGLIGVTFVVSMALAYRPSLDSAEGVALAVVPWLALVGLVVAWSGRSAPTRVAGILVATGAWAFLVAADERWTMLSFALYGLAFTIDTARLWIGLTLAGIVSVIWAVASFGGPAWTILIPLLVFAAASTIAFAIQRIGALTATQAELIRTLRSTREELASSERSRGVLEERTRLAGEIHDTLAQGFTSIVLLARAGHRTGVDSAETLQSIEATAQENLDTARRLVASSRPDELAEASLPDALRRHLEASLPDDIAGEFELLGSPVSLPGSIETVLLRAAQEGIRNSCTHAEPNQVQVALSYLDDAVTLTVRDDGIGFGDGSVHDRGTITGGQGLATLERRVESLSGSLSVDSANGAGSTLTVRIPVPS